MTTRLPSLLDRAILFAHRGARADSREHTVEAFEVATRLGATGIHVDAWATRDDHIVLNPGPYVRRFSRRRLCDTDLDDLPESFVRLEALYDAVGPEVAVGISTVEPASGIAAADIARDAGALATTWLGHDDLAVLAEWRDHSPDVRLVNATTLDRMPVGPERRAAELAAARIDAVALPEAVWSGGLVTLFHRFDVLSFAADANYERQLVRLIDMGIDAVIGDNVDRMVAVAATFD